MTRFLLQPRGVAIEGGRAGEVTDEEFDKSFQVKVKGTFHGCQLALERMATGGRIINMSSSTTGLMLSGYCVYDATKGAIEAMTHVIAKGVRAARNHRQRGLAGRI